MHIHTYTYIHTNVRTYARKHKYIHRYMCITCIAGLPTTYVKTSEEGTYTYVGRHPSSVIPSSTLLYLTLLCVYGVIWRSTKCYSLRRRPLHQFSTHIPKSVVSFRTKQLLRRLHPPKEHSEVRCINMVLPRVRLSTRHVKASLIFCWYETKSVSGIYRTFHSEPSAKQDSNNSQILSVFVSQMQDSLNEYLCVCVCVCVLLLFFSATGGVI